MRLLLAPMEGLLDFVLRDVLTRLPSSPPHPSIHTTTASATPCPGEGTNAHADEGGGIDRCVSEFIRISGSLLPERVFLRYIPELAHGSRTPAGIPVRAQLLGSDPICVAENAARLAELGPEGIDLNFGCPAKIVNRHGGGASMLQHPEAIAALVAAVRRAVPAHLPVSAKMRLGYHDSGLMRECAQAMAESGACEIVVHARTKADGYRPPAHWHLIPRIREAVAVPVIANGEIWTVADALRCRAESGCTDLMLGRGIVAHPGLALDIRAALASPGPNHPGLATAITWPQLLPHIQHFWRLVCRDLTAGQRAGRLKQWLNLLRRHHPEAQTAYDTVRTITDQRLITDWLTHQHPSPAAQP